MKSIKKAISFLMLSKIFPSFKHLTMKILRCLLVKQKKKEEEVETQSFNTFLKIYTINYASAIYLTLLSISIKGVNEEKA